MVKYSHIYPYIHIYTYIYIFMINDSPLLTRYFSIKSYYYYIYIHIYINYDMTASRCPLHRTSPQQGVLGSLAADVGLRWKHRGRHGATRGLGEDGAVAWRWGGSFFFFFSTKKKGHGKKLRFLNGLYGKNPSFFLKQIQGFFNDILQKLYEMKKNLFVPWLFLIF